MKKKVAIIGTVGLPANYGGFETLVSHLTEELNEQLDITVYCSSKAYPRKERVKEYNGSKLVYLPFKANGIQSIVYDSVSILHALFFADVLLVLGVSAGFLIPLVRLFTNKKIITSIDGIEWKRNKWNKTARRYLWAAEWLAVKFSHANIADNESIQDYTAIRYKTKSDIIEYGADHVRPIKPGPADYKKYPFLSGSYAIKVCRIEPENNIEMVLEAFSRLGRHTLVIVGNWNNSEYGIALRKKYGALHNIILCDPIYDTWDIDLLRSNATVYIHGHSAGGTNPSLIEAMSLQLPVIAYGVMYNKATTENKAFYFRTADELVATIEHNSIRSLKMQALDMRAIAERRYVWKVIALKYKYTIDAVCTKKRASRLLPVISDGLGKTRLSELGIMHLQSPALFYEKR